MEGYVNFLPGLMIYLKCVWMMKPILLFLYKGDIYIDKKTDGLNDDIEKIAYLESDSETKLFVSKVIQHNAILKKDKWGLKNKKS